MFSVSRALHKALQWLSNVDSVSRGRELARGVENAVSANTELERKAVYAEFRGDIHETRRPDGTVDPTHISGAVYTQSRSRLSSFHLYEDGLLVWSRSRFGRVRVPTDGAATSSTSSNQATQPATQASPNLTWQIRNNVPHYWSGSSWIPAEYSHEQQAWSYYYGGQWYKYG